MTTLSQRFRSLTLPPRLRDAVAPALGAAHAARRRALPVLAVVTEAGWVVLVLGVLAWLLGWLFGWREFSVLAAGCLTVVVLSAIWLIGRTRLTVEVAAEPRRVSVGEAVTGELVVTNAARGPLLPLVLDLPVGAGMLRFTLPLLSPGATARELFVVPTSRRGVIDLGPATSRRGDPLGLMRTDRAWTEVSEVFVHPRIVPLEPLGAGLLRDLEGTTSEDISQSDLAFHALREYVPGDDLRHVHWRSSAKAGQLLIRQFLDTRRSHLALVVDSAVSAYPDPEHYETAISAAASMLTRGLIDDYDVTFVSGQAAMTRTRGRTALDACCRAELGSEKLVDLSRKAFALAPDTSLAVFVTGGAWDLGELRRSAANYPPEVTRVALRIDPGSSLGLRRLENLTLLTLPTLEDLPILLARGIR